MKQFQQYEVYEGDKIKGSRFIAVSVPVSSLNDVRNIISTLQHQHPHANHCCWAVRLTSGVERSNDDGEPNGSAGAPILQRLQRANLLDSLIVVVRYFGGTKLGVGGLIRAYGGCANAAIEHATIQAMRVVSIYELCFSYSEQSLIRPVVYSHGGQLESESYTHVVRWVVLLVPNQAQNFVEQCIGRTSNRVIPEYKGQKMIRS